MQGEQYCRAVPHLVLTLLACSPTGWSRRPALQNCSDVAISRGRQCTYPRQDAKGKILSAAAPAGEHWHSCADTADACKAPRNLPYAGHRLWGEGAALHHPGASSKAAGMLVACCGRSPECQAVKHHMCSTSCMFLAGAAHPARSLQAAWPHLVSPSVTCRLHGSP